MNKRLLDWHHETVRDDALGKLLVRDLPALLPVWWAWINRVVERSSFWP
jgi:hypothetical protein